MRIARSIELAQACEARIDAHVTALSADTREVRDDENGDYTFTPFANSLPFQLSCMSKK